jgi:V/A-type H+/Na+-transporting ATPase subunit D
MAQIKLTKTELRSQQVRLGQLQKYLPTLQLKKALLQIEVAQSALELEQAKAQLAEKKALVCQNASLFSERDSNRFFSAIVVSKVQVVHENIAGVDIPIFQGVEFAPPTYSLFDTPIWYEPALKMMQDLIVCQEKVKVCEQKKRALEKELREVFIRVNLFEKIRIPRAIENIKKIKIFLGDQLLAAVSQAKVAKKKIIARESL